MWIYSPKAELSLFHNAIKLDDKKDQHNKGINQNKIIFKIFWINLWNNKNGNFLMFKKNIMKTVYINFWGDLSTQENSVLKALFLDFFFGYKRSLFPHQGSNLHPLLWRLGVLSSGLPRKSLKACIIGKE